MLIYTLIYMIFINYIYMNVVNEDPHICYYDNFITDEECEFIKRMYNILS